ncbi:hypothetical protein [Terrilactibacillus laevilacticus]|uniref:Uncharacterized protein n=1 Tax=Terrilactibacillus laevilacticus TaxID=1380157 RepID=A0ABW5PLY7_9BACI|nr:hypothetical protein [Terrilactibacillus laevilacticus]
MMYLDWFAETMKKTFNIEVKKEDVGYEAYDFYHEEFKVDLFNRIGPF